MKMLGLGSNCIVDVKELHSCGGGNLGLDKAASNTNITDWIPATAGMTNRHTYSRTTLPSQFMKTLFVACAALLLTNAFAAVGDIGVYTSPVRTFSTASYWIEGTDGVVMIDAQFLPKEGIQAVELAEKTTGKKVSTAIVLHSNPDKFNGTALMLQRGIRVITAKQVADLIPAVHTIRWDWFGKEYAPDYPKDAAKPDVFGEKTVELTLAGLPIKLHVLGKGTSGAHVVAQFRDQAFVGDLINPTNHAWLELGLIGDWLVRLEEIRAMNPTNIHPGRGASGGPAMIDTQAAYLKQVRTWVREALQPGDLGWFNKLRLARKIESAYPSLGYPIFMRDGLAAVWKSEQTIK
jgi:glyoxylase-like metal-dependent hydrolase (beta-lactamase superfamily II)